MELKKFSYFLPDETYCPASLSKAGWLAPTFPGQEKRKKWRIPLFFNCLIFCKVATVLVINDSKVIPARYLAKSRPEEFWKYYF